MVLNSRRQAVIFTVLAFIFLVALFYQSNDFPDVPRISTKPLSPEDRLQVTPATAADVEKFHLLLPATNGPSSLCKTLLSASVLGYPVPTLIGWNESFDQENLIGGGRHLAKISGILDWLETQPSSKDDDLVLVADAYGGFDYYSEWDDKESHLDGDMWFQLPPEVVIARYHAMRDRANKDLSRRMGRAYEKEGLRDSIMFAASKRCTPNEPSSAACYPIPSTPLPDDIYPWTLEGKARPMNYTTHRQRYLSTAFIIGPLREMRAMFRRAKDKASLLLDHQTSHAFDERLRLGSDQVIFHTMLGEQEFQREAMRRRNGERARRPTRVENVVINDVLNPKLKPHDLLIEKEGKPDEFGMHIDYWSDLGQQTMDSWEDAEWFVYGRSVEDQLEEMPRGPRSCTPRISGHLPVEITATTGRFPLAASSDPQGGWHEPPLYTNVCLGTIPALINHNGDPTERDLDWPRMWMQPHGRRLMQDVLSTSRADGRLQGGAYGGVGGDYLAWEELCPAKLDRDLYRDYWDNESI